MFFQRLLKLFKKPSKKINLQKIFFQLFQIKLNFLQVLGIINKIFLKYFECFENFFFQHNFHVF